MGTSLLQNLRELWRAFGYSMVSLQLAIWGAFFLVELLLLVAIPLSVTALGGVFYGIVAIYTPLALAIVFSPFIWGGIGTTATLVAQPGGEEGLSAKDALDKMSDWGKKSLETMLVYLVFFPPIFLVYLAMGGAKGWVNEHLLFVLLLPTLLVFIRIEFPGGRLAFRVIGWGLMLLVIGLLVTGAVNIANRQAIDPAVQEMQAYHDKQASNLKKDQQELVQLLINKVNETGVASLTPKQLKEWRYFEEQRAKQTPAGRVTSLATQVVTDVAQAKPSDPNWWQAHWYLPILGVGVIIALVILYRLFVRTAGGPDAEAHASAHGTKKGVTLWGIVCLAFLGWCVFSYATETGWPGVNLREDMLPPHQTKIFLKNLSDQKVCDQGLKPGTWHVSFPREIYLAHPSQNGRYDKVGGFYLLHKGEMLRKSFLEDVWVNGVRTGWNEMVTVGPDHCFTVTVNISPEVKAEAVMYGNPQCWSEHQQSCQASGVPRTAEVNLMFSQKAPIR